MVILLIAREPKGDGAASGATNHTYCERQRIGDVDVGLRYRSIVDDQHGTLSAIDRNHCPQSIGTLVRNRRNPQPVRLDDRASRQITPRIACAECCARERLAPPPWSVKQVAVRRIANVSGAEIRVVRSVHSVSAEHEGLEGKYQRLKPQ